MKRLFIRYIYALAITSVIILTGCARTSLTSQVNTEVSLQTYMRVMVDGNFEDLEHRQIAEEALCEKIENTYTCECLKSSDVFFPGQQYTSEQLTSRLLKNHVEAVLVFQPTNSGKSSTYIPKTSYTTGSAFIAGNTIHSSSRTQSYGGYNVSKPWAHYKATLLTVPEGGVAWYATAKSGGNAFAGWGDLIRSASGKIVDRLLSEGLLIKMGGQ